MFGYTPYGPIYYPFYYPTHINPASTFIQQPFAYSSNIMANANNANEVRQELKINTHPLENHGLMPSVADIPDSNFAEASLNSQPQESIPIENSVKVQSKSKTKPSKKPQKHTKYRTQKEYYLSQGVKVKSKKGSMVLRNRFLPKLRKIRGKDRQNFRELGKKIQYYSKTKKIEKKKVPKGLPLAMKIKINPQPNRTKLNATIPQLQSWQINFPIVLIQKRNRLLLRNISQQENMKQQN